MIRQNSYIIIIQVPCDLNRNSVIDINTSVNIEFVKICPFLNKGFRDCFILTQNRVVTPAVDHSLLLLNIIL